MDELLKVIYEKLGNTEAKDWEKIMQTLKGADNAETIENIFKFVEKYFSFAIEEGAEGYVYYGSATESTRIWQVVEGIVKDKKTGYISSTQAGKLFNDTGFNAALQKIIKSDILFDIDDITGTTPLYEGTSASGTIKIGQKTVEAFNDFFSRNYIKNLKCSNVKTLFAGNCTAGNGLEGTLNCFGRTEFFEIIDNKIIQKINGIDKNVFYYIYGASPSGKEIENVCTALKASEIPHISNIYYKIAENGSVNIVTKETKGAVRLVDTLIAKGKISSSTDAINKIISQCGDYLGENKAALEAISKSSDKALADILASDSEVILKQAGKDILEVGEYTLRRGKGVTQVLKNGMEIKADATKLITADEALAAGYEEAVYNGEKVLINNKGFTTGGVIKVILNGIAVELVLHEAYAQFKTAAANYEQGNYRTGSEQLIEYGTATLMTVAASELFMSAATTLCVAAGVATCGAATAIAAIGSVIAGSVAAFCGSRVGRWFGKTICDWLGYEDRVYSGAGSAYVYYSDPLVLDLAGDGFQLLSVENGVYFDEDAKRLAEKTEWVAPQDALLAIDLNEDGIINDGSELFGTSTRLADGSTARSAFEALKQYDVNNDNIIDINDDVFSKLKVWQDKNSDGISQQNELYSLDDLGIESISLNTAVESGITVASVNYTDGSLGKIGQFNFAANVYDTADKEKPIISEDISGLPDVRAMGNVASLHVLMHQDETGILKEQVKKFVASSDIIEKRELVSRILMFITGADNVASDSRGSEIDAKKLVAVEQIMGRDFVGRYGSDPVNTSAATLNLMYNDICKAYYSLLSVDSLLRDYMNLVYTTQKDDKSTYINTDMFDAYVKLCETHGINMTDEIAAMGLFVSTMNPENEDNFNDYIQRYLSNMDYTRAIRLVCDDNIYVGTDENDSLDGSSGRDSLFGGAGNDILSGANGDDYLFGDAGDDTLYGGDGDDKLYGGTGNDTIYGSYGDDTYYFNLGDGEDIIDEVSGSVGNADRIVFGQGISAENVKVERDGDDLIIRYSDTDKITVNDAYAPKQYWGTGYYFVENIEFADGTVWDTDKLTELASIHTGTDGDDNMRSYSGAVGYDSNETFYAGAGNDTIDAGDGNDVLFGETGDDTLYGGYGNDKLYGGTGNDIMYGGYDDDTYYFNLGDGEDIIDEVSGSVGNADKIVFGQGIIAENVRVERDGDDLIIRYSDTDKITVNDAYAPKQYWGTGYYFVENIEFTDGTVWDTDKLTELASIHTGTDGDDNMRSYSGAVGYDINETFHAGAGNDTIDAGDGNDVLFGEAGDDTLYGGYGNDKLYGGTGNDIMYGGYDDDTYYFNLGDGEDIIDEVSGSVGNADRIVFGQGISAENVKVERDGNDLIIRYSDTDKITVNDAYAPKPYYGTGYYFVENVEFADGTVWDTDKLAEIASIHTGTDNDDNMRSYSGAVGYDINETFHAGAGNDTIDAGDGNDVLFGGAGDDTLYGGYGDDKLYGGTGNDIMYGGYDDDTYYFNLGDGEDIIDEVSGSVGNADRIVFGQGISAENVKVERDGNDLIIRYSDTDKITVNDAYAPEPYYGTGYYFVENVEFADGTIWDTDKLTELASTRTGTDNDDNMQSYSGAVGYDSNETFYAGAGNDTIDAGSGNDVLFGEAGDDTLYGGDGDDKLYGGTGNDILYGGYGDDTYYFNLGDGEDIIDEVSGSVGNADKIVFGKGISEEGVTIERDGNDLIIRYSNTDKITVNDAYAPKPYYGVGYYFVENVEFEGSAYGNIDYDNVRINITERIKEESVDIKTDTVVDDNAAASETASVSKTTEIKPASAEVSATNSATATADNQETMKNGTKSPVSDTSSTSTKQAADTVTTAAKQSVSNDSEVSGIHELDKLTFSCAQEISDLYTSQNDNNVFESVGNGSIDMPASEVSIDSMANLIIQDMSENVSGNVVNINEETHFESENDKVQLWVS